MAGVTYEHDSTCFKFVQTQKYLLDVWLKIYASNNINAHEMVWEDLILAEYKYS